jgi:hypothetical protein
MKDGDQVKILVPFDIVNAIEKVRQIFQEAILSGKHKSGDWRALGIEGNATHLKEHWIRVMTDDVFIESVDDGDDHLANLCCRALMLLQLREDGSEELR